MNKAMDNSGFKPTVLLGIVASILLILMGIYFAPGFIERNLSPDGVLDPVTVTGICLFRIGAVITGILLLSCSLTFLLAPQSIYRLVDWLQKRSSKAKSLSALILLLFLACVCYLPFTYQGVLGEGDSYLMVTGYLDSINSGTPYNSPLLYARQFSFGYYAWLYLFSDAIQAKLAFIISLMNFSNAIGAVLMVVPLFFVVRRYWELSTAVYANLILILIPVWWQMSRYGHPQLLAILFMFTGIALLCYRSHFASKHQSEVKIFVFDVLIVAALSLCLTWSGSFSVEISRRILVFSPN